MTHAAEGVLHPDAVLGAARPARFIFVNPYAFKPGQADQYCLEHLREAAGLGVRVTVNSAVVAFDRFAES